MMQTQASCKLLPIFIEFHAHHRFIRHVHAQSFSFFLIFHQSGSLPSRSCSCSCSCSPCIPRIRCSWVWAACASSVFYLVMVFLQVCRGKSFAAISAAAAAAATTAAEWLHWFIARIPPASIWYCRVWTATVRSCCSARRNATNVSRVLAFGSVM
jgi:hypothetical protein